MQFAAIFTKIGFAKSNELFRMLFAGGAAENIPTDADDDVVVDDDEDDDDENDAADGDADDKVLALNTALPDILLDFVVKVAADANGEENRLSFVLVPVGGVILNVGAVAAAAFDCAIGVSIFLLSIIGAFGAGNDAVVNLISVLFNFSCTFGKSTGSGGISCCSIFPAFRCFEVILFRILLTCLLLLVVMVVVVIGGDL